MNIKCRLIILSIDYLQDGSTQLVAQGDVYPSLAWEGNDTVKTLACKYVSLDYNYIQPSLIDAREVDGEMNLTYRAIVPNGTAIKEGQWVSMSMVSNELQEVTLKAMRTI
jgi:hypothetical protein